MNRNRIVALFVFGWALALWPSTGSAFCTIAGNCEPTPTGKIVVTHIGKSKQPVPATFRLYPAGKPASFRHLVQTGHAGKPVELLTGKYDVLIAGNPPLWGRGVEVKSGETVSVVLGGVGGLLVAGKDSAGKPVRSGIVVYVAGAERKAANIVTTGRTNERVPIVAGVYDVRADLSPDIWFESVAVSRNEVTELGLPEPTTIRISVFDPDGKPLSEFVFIQGLDGKNVRATKQTNTEIAMSPGRYDIRVKGDYIRVDTYRYARRHNLQFVLTEGTDLIDPLPPARAFQWVKAKDPEMGKALALGLQEAYWGRGIDVAHPQNLIEVANGLGMDGKEILAGAESEEAKDFLRSDVEEGISRGVFGSPFVLVDGEPFWGVDKLELVDEWMTHGGW